MYLIHDNNFIRSILYHKIFNIDKFYNHPFGTFIVLGFVIIVFIVCVVIDLVRQGLFKGVITIFKKVKDGKENKLYNNMNDSLNQNQDNN